MYRSTRDGMFDAFTRSRTTARATAHPPLAVMLVLTQLAVGAFIVDLAWRTSSGVSTSLDAVLAAAAGVVALGASVLHLGRPRYCYRAVIGLRHSWLSREVWRSAASRARDPVCAGCAAAIDGRALDALGGLVAAFGIAGLASSVMIYATTHRRSWRVTTVAWKFSLTTVICGLAAVLWASTLSSRPFDRRALLVLAVLTALKLLAEGVHGTTSRRAAVAAVAIATLVLVPYLPAGAIGMTVALVSIVTGELLERSLFFTMASPPE